MNINSYADFTDTTWKKDTLNKELFHAVSGLVEEVGEFHGLLKRFYREGDWDNKKAVKELGDIIYYWVRLCRRLGVLPGDVLQANIDKLTDRKERGVLLGSGDNR